MKYLPEVAVGVVTVVAAPIVVGGALGAVGFGTSGIAAGSIAAKAMSASAIANGGGVAAGGVISTLQAVGATGIALKTSALLGGAASGATACIQKYWK